VPSESLLLVLVHSDSCANGRRATDLTAEPVAFGSRFERSLHGLFVPSDHLLS
jgi:hypothetical protein